MEPYRPRLEIEHNWDEYNPPVFVTVPWYKSHRLMIFVISLLTSLAISLTFVFTQPAIFQSYASLLTVAKTAIDQRSSETDIQHVFIQKQILLGQELISKTAKRLQSSKDINSTLSIANIHQMLSVEAVENTNLVKMIAEGPNPAILPLLINTWLDIYLDSRKKDVTQSTSSITESLQQELNSLTVKIESKRHELDIYRKENNISSSQRDENEALAHLKGLNDALNTATEEVVNSKARLQSVTHAINSGQEVVSEADTRTLSLLELQAQVLREQVADMDQRFTRQYIAMVPSLKIIPEKLEKLEAQISELRTSGKYVVLDDAKQKYAAATQALKNIRNQLNVHNKQTADFTTLFTKHEALQSDLKNLDILFNETQDRLIKIEAKQIEKRPQVSVVERAFLPQQPIRPNYIQDALIAIAGSIFLSLSLVWFVNFLNRKDEANTAINLSGIHLYNSGVAHQNALNNNQTQSLAQQQNFALEKPVNRGISNQDLNILLLTSNDKSKQIITLLLSGLSLEEIASLTREAINNDSDLINIPGSSARNIPLNPVLKTFFSKNSFCLVDELNHPLTSENLAAILHCSIVDAGLSASNEIDSAAIHLNYIIYLVMQGMRLSDLELVFGSIPPTELSSYSAYSPPVPGRPFKEINLLHPALNHLT